MSSTGVLKKSTMSLKIYFDQIKHPAYVISRASKSYCYDVFIVGTKNEFDPNALRLRGRGKGIYIYNGKKSTSTNERIVKLVVYLKLC
ncbi:MAG: hypothetical protein Crog4KO_36310 [Crocinitomicaceae bacterium]